MASKVMKRKYVIGLLVLLAMATVSTYAWSANELTTDPTNVYVSSSPGSLYTVTSYSSRPYGKNNVTITFKLAGAIGTPNVGLQFLNGTTGAPLHISGTVTVDGVAVSANADNTYTLTSLAGTVAGTQHWVSITETGAWKDLDSTMGGNQYFSGVMLVIP